MVGRWLTKHRAYVILVVAALVVSVLPPRDESGDRTSGALGTPTLSDETANTGPQGPVATASGGVDAGSGPATPASGASTQGAATATGAGGAVARPGASGPVTTLARAGGG